MTPDPTFDTTPVAFLVSRHYMLSVETALKQALVARFGTLPPMEEITKHCHRYTTADGTSHFAWLDETPGIGDTMDVSTVILSVAPPKFHTP